MYAISSLIPCQRIVILFIKMGDIVLRTASDRSQGRVAQPPEMAPVQMYVLEGIGKRTGMYCTCIGTYRCMNQCVLVHESACIEGAKLYLYVLRL